MLVLPNNCQIWEKKRRIPLNVTKVKSNVMLVLSNMTMEPSNVRKKIKEPLNMIKILSNVILVLLNVTMELSNVRKKKGNHQMWQKNYQMWCWNCIMRRWNRQNAIKKKRELPNVTKVLSNVMLELHHMRMKPSNVRK